MIPYIDEHARSFGVEPICRTLQIAPSSYYAAKRRPASARSIADEELKARIAKVHTDNRSVYGAYKLCRELRRKGEQVGRDRVARLVKALGIVGVTRQHSIRTRSAETATRPDDPVERAFSASAPNRLWVADLTYVWTIAGFAYTAFVVDVFSRRIVGWRSSASLRTDLALDALEMAIAARGRRDPDGLVHHSDRGVQYLSIRYTERLAEAGVVNSVGSRGDSYDNALAETVNGLYKTELIRRRARWRTVEEVEFETASWVHRWSEQRLHSACDFVPPAEFEAAYYAQQAATLVHAAMRKSPLAAMEKSPPLN